MTPTTGGFRRAAARGRSLPLDRRARGAPPRPAGPPPTPPAPMAPPTPPPPAMTSCPRRLP
jgi:hypothetical protein